MNYGNEDGQIYRLSYLGYLKDCPMICVNHNEFVVDNIFFYSVINFSFYRCFISNNSCKFVLLLLNTFCLILSISNMI